MEGTGIPSGGSRLVSCCIIRSASVAVTFRFGTIDWVLGGGESSEIEGGSSETEGRLFETGGDETSKIGGGLSEIEGRLFETGRDETSAHFGAPQPDWSDFLCSGRGLLPGRLGVAAQLKVGEKGYGLLYSCTHNHFSTHAHMPIILPL
jgi:hypothetical protein